MARDVITLIASYTLMTLVLTEQRAANVNGNTDSKPTCETPVGELDGDPETTDNDLRYIYNGKNCTSVLVKPERFNETYPDRISCIKECSQGQDTTSCTNRPPDACSKDKGQDEDPNTCENLFGDGGPYVAYYYNATLGVCKEYCVCEDPEDRNEQTNFFNLDEFCDYRCRGYKEFKEAQAVQIETSAS
uniref:Putative serine proteinase inhibitor n=1 Tax=Hyalomma excavatum TaxID=257692 RepID=A0A131XND7_9ACAR